MNTGGRIAAAGGTFAGIVLACFAAGVVIGNRTGSALGPIGGIFVGLVLGIGAFIALMLRAVR